jgi:hypothetical protein
MINILAELVATASASLAVHAVAEPGPGRFEGLIEDRDRLFVAETVYEGYLMHYGTPRAFRGMDEDMRLLAGDSLYALGLSRLAERGDLEAIAELSDLISICAQSHAEGRAELADEAWLASARALAGEGPGARSVVGARLPAARRDL